MLQILLGQAPLFFWWFIAPGALIFLLAVAASRVLRAYATLVEKRGNREIGLAASQARLLSEARHRPGNSQE